MITAIDMFAGWGGFTEGAKRAGVQVAWAGNHWQTAVDAHAQNHPATKHVCQDLRQADWSEFPDHELMLAAPACQGHSQAAQPSRAGSDRTRSKHDALRATAWAVVDCAEVCVPKAVIVENVPDFRRWKLFPRWRGCLEDLGYHVQEHILRASLMGTPQRRDRLFVVATRKQVTLDLRIDAQESPFSPHIDQDADNWRSVAKASERVRERIAKGRRNYGRTFLTQHVTGHPGVPLDQPIRTITTQDQWAIVEGKWYRPLSLRENARAMGFGDDYFWPENSTRRETIKGLGNAVCPPVAERLVGAVAAAI